MGNEDNVNILIQKLIASVRDSWPNGGMIEFAIDRTLRALNECDPNWHKSNYAIDHVPQFFPVLLDKNEHDYIRETVAIILGLISDNRSVDPLIAAFQESRSRGSVGRRIAHALALIGDSKAIKPLGVELESYDATMHNDWCKDTIECYVNAIVEIGGIAAIETLVAALKNENSFVRQYAASGIGKIGDTTCIESLVGILEDHSEEVRASAANALCQIGSAKVVEPLSVFLCNPYNVAWVRKAVAKTLGKIGDPRAVEYLISSFGTGFHTDGATSESDFMYAVIESLKKIDPNWSKSEEAKKKLMHKTIAVMGDGRDSNALLKLLNEIDPNWRNSDVVKKEIFETITDFDLRKLEMLEMIDKNWYKSEAVKKLVPKVIAALSRGSLLEHGELLSLTAVSVLRLIADNAAIVPLLALLKSNKYITYREHITQVIKDIVDVNKPLLENYSKVTCSRCSCKAENRTKRAGLFKAYRYLICPNCDSSLYLVNK